MCSFLSENRRFSVLGIVVMLLFVAFPQAAMSSAAPARIVVAGGPLTEVVYALGAGGAVVGVDTSSSYPPEVTLLPKVGYQRTLSAEGILSLRPDALLASDEAGPPAVLEQLRRAGVRVEILATARSVEQTEALIRRTADVLDREAAADSVVARLREELGTRTIGVDAAAAPRLLFVYARGGGTLLVAGTDTPPAALIELAGGVNAVREFAGYRPLSAEAVVVADPEMILVSKDGLASLGGIDGLLGLPGLDRTRAAAKRRVAIVDDAYLLGFGPRLGAAVRGLREQIRSGAAD